jgi:FAD/FMN-containing dehydrogenase
MLSGTLVLPGDPSYAVDKLLYNERFDAISPAALAYCANPTDVQRCVAYAREHGVALTARSGGHSYGGYSTGTGLVIDVSSLNAIALVDGTSNATCGAGTELIDLYNTLGNQGLLVPGGSCPTVGIAGLTLGGGIGVVGRKYGLACDQLTSIDLVLADGRLINADAEHNPDLYWASRGGGGGNFGIATSFTFSTNPVPPIALFTLGWPWAAAGDVLGSWQSWIPATPDELWSNCQLLSSGSSGTSVRVTGVFAGTTDACSAALAPLLRAVTTPPDINFVGPENYVRAMFIEAGCEDLSVAQCHAPSENPAGTLSRSAFAAKSGFVVTPLSGAGISAAVNAVDTLASTTPQVGGGLVFDSFGGAINQVPASDTAFVHRDALACLQYDVNWGANAPSSVSQDALAWLSNTQTALAPYLSGAYQNYIDPTLTSWLDHYYGSNLDRLVQIKRAVDPDDVFHFAQSIPTVLPR